LFYIWLDKNVRYVFGDPIIFDFKAGETALLISDILAVILAPKGVV
jgi:hypothetical protein